MLGFSVSSVLIRRFGYLKSFLVLCGWLVRMKQPRVFPEDKIQRWEKCKRQSKLIGSCG